MRFGCGRPECDDSSSCTRVSCCSGSAARCCSSPDSASIRGDVFHQGLSRRLGLGVGTWSIIIGAAVLLLWIPLRQRPGFGTLSNVLVVGLVIDLMLDFVPPVHALPAQIVVMVGGVVLNGDRHRRLHRRRPRARPARRPDDRPGGARPLDPRRSHLDRAHGATHRLAAGRHGRGRNRGVRALDRTARPRDDPAAADSTRRAGMGRCDIGDSVNLGLHAELTRTHPSNSFSRRPSRVECIARPGMTPKARTLERGGSSSGRLSGLAARAPRQPR